MTIIRDAVRAIKTMSGRWMYVDDRDLYVACIDHAADWPAWDGSILDRDGRIVEPQPRAVDVEPPPYEPTEEEVAWLGTLEDVHPWMWMTAEEIEADRHATLASLAWETDDPPIGGCGGHDLD